MLSQIIFCKEQNIHLEKELQVLQMEGVYVPATTSIYRCHSGRSLSSSICTSEQNKDGSPGRSDDELAIHISG